MDTFKASDFSDLMSNSSKMERIRKGEKMLLHLLPEENRTELKNKGIYCIVFQNCLKRNHEFVFSFVSRGKIKQISCQIGKRIIFTNNGREHLLSLEQLSRRIREEISMFIQG